LLVLVIMQTILFRYNKYFVELEKKLKIFWVVIRGEQKNQKTN
jgi:hypothetical protein